LPASKPNSRSESEQLRRESTMRQLVQQTRQANSLPLCSPEELASRPDLGAFAPTVPTHMLSLLGNVPVSFTTGPGEYFSPGGPERCWRGNSGGSGAPRAGGESTGPYSAHAVVGGCWTRRD
jgi:hypothetical protein